MRGSMSGIAGCAVLLFAPAVWACGGLFCNASQPVNQAAERILFALDDEAGEIHMHVRITYQGPPTEFGWLVPVPPGVDTALSSEALFQGLDNRHAPRFVLRTEFEEGCPPPPPAPQAGGNDVDDDGVSDGVNVLSREPIGPYDRAILQADDIAPLREWLDDNGYQIPPETDAKLVPYIEAGAVFVALKLLPDAGAGDIVPLRLTFPGSRPSIPIVPTGVAADPDMGVIVHVLGSVRAVPLNYRHVEINEAAIDWQAGGTNYPDVVSQAADEAGGKAFTTDFAGPLDPSIVDTLRPITDDQIAAFAALTRLGDLQNIDFQLLRDPDVQRVLISTIDGPGDFSVEDYLMCPGCDPQYDAHPIDGGAIAARIDEEVAPPREHLAELFAAHGYLTRLYTTLSANEMSLDPVFSFNPDLPEVSATRTAVQRIPCEGAQPMFDAAIIALADGREFALADVADNAVRREGGEVVAGGAVPAARRVEQLAESGEPELIDEIVVIEPGDDPPGDDPPGDNPPDMRDPIDPGRPADAGVDGPQLDGTGSSDDSGGCGCRLADDRSPSPLLGLVLIAGLLRRRRRRHAL